jgi:hypothetical protein
MEHKSILLNSLNAYYLKEVAFVMVLWTETWAELTAGAAAAAAAAAGAAAAVVVNCQIETGFLSVCV